MDSTIHSLISAEDVALIRRSGSPAGLRSDLAAHKPNGSIVLSEYGTLFYIEACKFWGVELQTVFDSEYTFFEFQDRILKSVQQTRERALMDKFQSGRLDARELAWLARFCL